MHFLKRIAFWGCLVAILYVFVSYHFVFFGKKMKILKKTEPTLRYTIFSVHAKSNKTILSIKQLRESGIADVLVEMGTMTKAERRALMAKYKKKGH